MASDYIFKKSAFGGFNREDVIAYISKVKAEETIMKNALEEEKAKNAELANMLQDAEKKQTEAEEDYKEKIKELNESHKIAGKIKAKVMELKDIYDVVVHINPV